jgi:hypothetical protein
LSGEKPPKGSKGMDPCPILEWHGGIWQFDANKKNQKQADGVRYATGLRNVVGLDWNKQQGELYAMQHGRDQLNTMFSTLYNAEQNAELPSEEFCLVKKALISVGHIVTMIVSKTKKC